MSTINMEDATEHRTSESDPIFDDTELEDAINGANQSLAPVTEADTSFYSRVLDSCKSGIDTIDKQLADINDQAQRLLESKRKLTADRQRLATQRNAARISMRYLEDSEAKRQASGS